ncbi:flagellar protein [bacterium BFN5]|nr:flagellar protein [bacterium BFN5]
MSNNRIYFQQPINIPVNKNGIGVSTNSVSRTLDNQSSFQDVLQQELGVKFSQHALQRLQSRDIKMGPAELNKLNNAVEKAAQKGAKESLILMNDLALVVSVKNKTVITAMDGASMKDNVFTNIDSAVII